MTNTTHLDPLIIAADPAFRAAGEAGVRLFRSLAERHGADAVGIAWIQACLAIDQGAASDPVNRVRALHTPTDRNWCSECTPTYGNAVGWPCRTIRELD